MYVKDLLMKGYRCFEDQGLELVVPPEDGRSELRLPNITVLLGNNGAGKSTALAGIALAALGSAFRDSGWVPRSQVRRPTFGSGPSDWVGQVADLRAKLKLEPFEQEGGDADVEVRVTLERTSGVRERFGEVDVPDRITKILYSEESPQLFLAGYGSTRRAESGSDFDASRQQQRYAERFQRVATLFQDDFTLVPLAAWLPDADVARHNEVQDILRTTLDSSFTVTDEYEAGDLVVEDGGIRLPASQLCDGYRNFLAWVGDLLYRLHRCTPEGPLRDVPGVVLVDEIALHLHPEWQRRVIPSVSSAFPRLQFVLTTHSPLVVGSLEAQNLRVMVKSDGVATVSPARESPYGLSGDQVLLSDYFGLREVRDADFERTLGELRSRAIKGDVEAADDVMRLLTSGAEGLSKKPPSRKKPPGP